MSEEKIESIRHTLAHVLAQAVSEKYPHAKSTIGPAIDDGFYYDFDFSDGDAPGDADLADLQKAMRKNLKKWDAWEHEATGAQDARSEFAGNEYKVELIDELEKEGAEITLYTSGGFTDLCRGGHTDNPAKDIDPKAFKLHKIAGAYWRGDEKNTMLTRIYGFAFENEGELKKHIETLEEAKKRDHRKLGKELDLFLFSDLVGPGLPLFTPRGTLLRNSLDSFVWKLREERGYVQVDIPHLTKKELYEKSGHWDKFGDELFRIKTREDHTFVVKPMNCPHHTQIYARKQHSYRELPQRYANTTKVYRDEQTGELNGLSRVRSITQDDAHVFCRYSQVKEEAAKIWDIVDEFYGALGFELKPTLSTNDPNDSEKYLGTPETWEKSITELRTLGKERGVELEEFPGEAAFYGPKIDFIAKDSMGREWQVATIQLDMNMPEGFDLTCTNEKGEKERIVMLHAAIMGAIERFLAVYIEHTAGNFPVWLAPEQVRILSISEKHSGYAQEVYEVLKKEGVRVALDDSAETLGKRIRNVKVEKVPYFLVLGDDEVSGKNVTVESRDDGKVGVMNTNDFVTRIHKEVETRAL